MLVADNEFHSPEIEALVPGINGLLFNSNDPKDLAASIVTLVNDPARLEQMSQAAEATVSKGYGVQDMVESFKTAITYAFEHQ
jgi:hypothetical protein